MAPRSIWSGTVSFGLVAIPVSIVPAVREKRVAFHLLHDADGARLKRRLFCPEDEHFIHPEHVVRGYEVEPEKYVVVREDEFEKLEPERSRTIEIQEFVDLNAIDSRFYDRTYYLVPGQVPKPYALLVQALAETAKVGIGKFVMHSREKFVAIRSLENALCLFTLHFAAEMVSGEELMPKNNELTKKEIAEAKKLVKEMKTDFEPDNYPDMYREKALNLIEKKRKNNQVVTAPEEAEPEEETGDPEELMEALQKSLQQAKKRAK